jgi:hypothetical protein
MTAERTATVALPAGQTITARAQADAAATSMRQE